MIGNIAPSHFGPNGLRSVACTGMSIDLDLFNRQRKVVVPLLILIGMFALLAGCVKDAAILVHPQSGKEVQCGPYYFTGMSSGIFSEAAADERKRQCTSGYQQQGYERK